MNAFQTDLQALVAKHIAAAPPARLLQLVDSLATPDAEVTARVGQVEELPRFVNLDAAGNPTAGDHVAVYDRTTDLIWLAEPVQSGKEFTHAMAIKAATAVDCMGLNDWRAPTIQEQLSIIDYTRCDPAVDTTHFKGPCDWYWTATKAAVSVGCAWGVVLHDGYSFCLRRGHRGRVRAVRKAANAVKGEG